MIPGYSKISGGDPLILQSAQATDQLSDAEPVLRVTPVNVLKKEVTFLSPLATGWEEPTHWKRP